MLSPELDRLTAGLTRRPGATDADLAGLLRFAAAENISVPADYLDFLRHSNGAYGPAGGEGLWIRLDPAQDVVPITSGQHAPGGLLLIGSTRLGDALALDARFGPTQIVTLAVSWWGNWDALDPLGATLAEALAVLTELGPLPLPWASRAGSQPDVGFVPTPFPMVQAMLSAAELKPGEMVYDLGCGDGRIIIAAARQFGARGVGFDLNVELVQVARAAAAAAGVRNLVSFRRANIFTVDLSPADVVTLYLLREMNLKLLPQFKALKPGARIVSYEFDIPGHPPARTSHFEYEPGVEGRVQVWEAPF